MYIANASKTCCDVRYKIILTDIQMPVMDGVESAKIIMQNNTRLIAEGNRSLSKIKIVTVSAYNDEEIK